MKLRTHLGSSLVVAFVAGVLVANANAQNPAATQPAQAVPQAAVPTQPATTQPVTAQPVTTQPATTPPATKADVEYDPTRPVSETNKPAAAKPAAPAPASLPLPAPAPARPVSAESILKAAGKASTARSFLWEVKSPSTTAYLFGTIHVGKRSFYPLPPAVEEALSRSTRLVVEADISNSSGSGDLASIISYKAPDGLDQHIPAKLYDRLKVQLARLNVPEAAARPMKPFIIGGLLSISEFSRLGYDMNYGVDSYLLGKARETGKPVLELESQRSQLEMMAGMAPELQVAFLENSIRTLESGNTADQVTGMVNAWQSGDTQLMQEVADAVNGGMRLNDRIDEVLVWGRHEAMQKKIEGFLASTDTYFIAVGSLHLIGAKGLLQGLKSKGYQVIQQ